MATVRLPCEGGCRCDRVRFRIGASPLLTMVFTRPEGLDGLVVVRATLLDDPGWYAPFIETMTGEKLPWATTPAVCGFETWPALEDYERLTQEYAVRAGTGRT